MLQRLFFALMVLLIPCVAKTQASVQTQDSIVAVDSSKVKKVVQIAGVTVSGDSLSPVPFANVIIKGNYSGTIADFGGFFSIIASTGDTLIFSSLGYKNSEYVIPDSLESKQYSLIQILDRDTVLVPVVSIKVWPTYEQFKKAFLSTEVPDDDLALARKNLDKGVMKDKVANLNLGAVGNQRYMLDQYKSRLYSAGQLPPNNLLNPIAWMKFIKAWKEGKLGEQ